MSNIKKLLKVQYKNYVRNHNKFVFTHVPKCAGSALSQSLLQGLYPSIIRNSPLTTGIDIKHAKEISKTLAFDEQKVREVLLVSFLESQKKIFITGHCYANPNVVSKYGSDWNFITVLRDPIDRFVSEYVYNTFKSEKWKNNSLPLDDYLNGAEARASSITYARFFSGMANHEILESPKEAVERSIKNLKNFYKVGFLDELNVWVNELNDEFNSDIRINKTNSSPNSEAFRAITDSKNKMETIRQMCEIDCEIYNELRKLKK